MDGWGVTSDRGCFFFQPTTTSVCEREAGGVGRFCPWGARSPCRVCVSVCSPKQKERRRGVFFFLTIFAEVERTTRLYLPPDARVVLHFPPPPSFSSASLRARLMAACTASSSAWLRALGILCACVCVVGSGERERGVERWRPKTQPPSVKKLTCAPPPQPPAPGSGSGWHGQPRRIGARLHQRPKQSRFPGSVWDGMEMELRENARSANR